jgi:hypothetical protein
VAETWLLSTSLNSPFYSPISDLRFNRIFATHFTQVRP